MLARHAGFVYERVFFIDPLPCCLFVRHWWIIDESLMIIDDHWWSWYIPAILAAAGHGFHGFPMGFPPATGYPVEVPKSWALIWPWSLGKSEIIDQGITECPHANYMVIFGYIPYGSLWPIEMIESHLPRTWWCSAMSNYQRLCNLIKTGGYLQFSNITMQNPRFWYPLVNIQKAIENHYV